MRPFLIGLTGGIGSGKSTVAGQLELLGAEIINGDHLGRLVLENSLDLLAQIRARFGDGVFEADGTLRRRALGERVFADPSHARWLTRLTFPGIHALWREAVEESEHDVVVLDAALIFEWEIESEFDLLLIVQADREQVRRRMLADGRLTPEEVDARLASQIPPDLKARRAHVVLTNNGSLTEFRKEVAEFWTARVVPELQQRRMREHGSSC